MSKPSFKERWQIKSQKDFWIIMCVFACTGFSAMFFKPLAFDLLQISKTKMESLTYFFAYIAIVTPFYQVALLFWSTIFRKTEVFKNFIKNLLKYLIPIEIISLLYLAYIYF